MAGHHAQCGCLAAAGRSKQATIGAGGNLEVDGVNGGDDAVLLRQLHQFERRRRRHPHHPHCLTEDPGRPWHPERYPELNATDVPKIATDETKSGQSPLFDEVDCAAPTQIGGELLQLPNFCGFTPRLK
ncbi:MAG TPA: hypothetical protein VEN78_15555 [Bradyrhizobium sp.]|nr:hypothetical protein [Bradyrhizobium sp.]